MAIVGLLLSFLYYLVISERWDYNRSINDALLYSRHINKMLIIGILQFDTGDFFIVRIPTLTTTFLYAFLTSYIEKYITPRTFDLARLDNNSLPTAPIP